MKRIVIKSVDKPLYGDPDDMLKWFCDALGLTTSGAADDIEVKLLKTFIIAAANNEGISSSDIKLDKNIARTTIIYHINRLIESGLVVKKGRKYYLRAQGLSNSLEEIEYDIEREMRRMFDAATEFDRIFNANYNNQTHKKGKMVHID